MKGKAYLVGAGVGNVAYLTVKAQELLATAEVLIYDALVSDELLNLVSPDCLLLNVGKRGGKQSTPQSQINQLLVAYCCQDKKVVRLKSGDPLIFGRAKEEITALEAAGCQYEIVPGISSVLAAPLLAGISLTDKELSSCFAIITGHQPQKLNWEALAKIDTLVILMGTRSLSTIVNSLIESGRSPQDSVAIIHNCSQPGEKIWKGTLTDIVKKTAGISLSPAVIVIGQVVSAKPLISNQSQPLKGRTILVTRALGQSSKFTALLQSQGATVIEMPALAITPPSSWLELDNAIAELNSFTWLILTSANGVNYFFERLKSKGLDSRALAGIKIAVVGKKTAAVLEKYNIQPDFIPPNYVADSLVATFPHALPQQKILFPRVESGGREILKQELSNGGATVIEVSAYESGCPKEIDETAWQALQNQQIDIITFASSKTVTNFVELIKTKITSEEEFKALLANVAIASIGPQTSQTCHDLLGRVDIEAKEYTLEGLTEAMVSRSKE